MLDLKEINKCPLYEEKERKSLLKLHKEELVWFFQPASQNPM